MSQLGGFLTLRVIAFIVIVAIAGFMIFFSGQQGSELAEWFVSTWIIQMILLVGLLFFEIWLLEPIIKPLMKRRMLFVVFFLGLLVANLLIIEIFRVTLLDMGVPQAQTGGIT